MSTSTSHGSQESKGASEIVDVISTDDYIKSTIDAGNRVRQLIYILCFGSIISLIAFWNAFDGSWINDRFRTIYEADEHYMHDSALDLHKVPCAKWGTDSQRVFKFLNDHEINTKEKLAAYKKIYTDLKENIFTVRVPILGLGFDINDLGVFSGTTFAFLFILLLLAIGREHDNLVITFNYSEKNHIIGRVYYYLAMGQMLADPPKPSKTKKYKHDWVRKNIVKALFLLPLICQGAILGNDIASYSYAKYLSASAARSSIVVSCILFGANICVVIASIYKEIDMDRLWAEYSKKIPLEDIQPGL